MSASFFKCKICCIIAILSLISLPLAPLALSKTEDPESVFFQRGMCFVTWNNSDYNWSEKAIENLKNLGVDHLQIVTTQYQDRVDSKRIKPIQKTPSNSSIKKAIKNAHKNGMKVMLKPHIDLLDDGGEDYWRADIGFYNDADWDKWFESYKKFILNYAQLAEENGVEMFCIGTELSFTTQKTEHWNKIIEAIKEVYSGDLIYAANWDNYKNVKFWDKLDYAGIDGYFPISYEKDPDLTDLLAGWKKHLHEIRRWQEDIGKPVVFTEIGYPSSIHGASEPWANGRGEPALELQAQLYTAFFESFANRPWLAGIYWWECGPSVDYGGRRDNHFTPLNKPAEDVVAKYYAQIGPREVMLAQVPFEESLELERIVVEGSITSLNDLLAEKLVPLDVRSELNIGSPGTAMLAPPLAGDVFTRVETEIALLPDIEELTLKDNEKYRGETADGLPDGRGIITYANGDKYAGEFKNGLRDGTGAYEDAHGNLYIGEFSGGVKEGKGVFFWKNGSVYSGEFENDLPHGRGTEIRSNGFRYEGEFKFGYLNGKGFVLKRSGAKYEGDFKQGIAHGKGILTQKDGTIIEGEFRDGFPVQANSSTE